MIHSASNRDSPGERGAELVEFAVIFPMILLLIYVLIDFGVTLGNRGVVSECLRGATRVASSVEQQCGTLAYQEFQRQLADNGWAAGSFCFAVRRESVVSDQGVLLPLLHVSVSSRPRCILCEFISKTKMVTLESYAPLQRPYFCVEPDFERCV